MKDAGPGARFHVGEWLADPSTGSLHRDGAHCTLEPRLMQVLAVLAGRAGEVVSSEQLLIECWRGTFYGDNPVHKAVAELRRALGDSAAQPRYIQTLRKRGYRLVAAVTFASTAAGSGRATATWNDGAPYVGLRAFEASHRDVFFGRAPAQAEVLNRLRRRLDEERAFLLLLGPSGCGKSSLLRAGVLPLLLQPGGFRGCRVLAWAEVDAAQAAADAEAALADALLAWQVAGAALFLPAEREFLIDLLGRDPALLAARIGERLARRSSVTGLRQTALLLLDQLEQLLLAAGEDGAALQRLFVCLGALLRGGHVMVLAACRDDFYARVVAVPALLALKLDGGSLDLPLLGGGELAQIIRAPAQAAGLQFEIDPLGAQRLDDVLRDEAVQQPQSLPLLQHALLELYQQRSGGLLTFAAYRAIGGLQGALARRAEQVFATLPAAARQQLPALLRRMVVLAGDDGLPVGRRVPWSELAEAPLRQLAQAFVERRLFVAARVGGVPGVAAAHESLFRDWPRAAGWVAENHRLLLLRARLESACRRWREEGRRRDFLLPPGSQLDDALQLRAQLPRADAELDAFVAASARRWRRQRRRAAAGLAALLLLAVAASLAGAFAWQAREQAERRRIEAEGLVAYMLGDLTERLRALGRLEVLDSVGNEALRYLVALPDDDAASTQLLRVRALRQIGEIRFARGEAAAVDAFAHALEAAGRLARREPRNPQAWLELGNAAFWRGQAAYQQGDFDAAAVHWQRYHGAARELLALQPDDTKAQMELSYALNNLATLDFQALRLDAARTRFAESSALKRAVLAATPADEGVAADLADSLNWQAQVEEAALRLAAAERYQQESLAVVQRLRADRPDDQRWIHREALAQQHLARSLLSRGEAAGAAALLLAAEAALQRIAAADPSNREWARDAALAGLQAGIALQPAQPARAADSLRLAQQQLQALAAAGTAGDAALLSHYAQLRLLYLQAGGPQPAQLDALAAALRAAAVSDPFAVRLLAEVLLARASSAAGGTAALAEARRLLAGLAGIDADLQSLRLRAALADGDAAAARGLHAALAAAGYRHPDYLRFCASLCVQGVPP